MIILVISHNILNNEVYSYVTVKVKEENFRFTHNAYFDMGGLKFLVRVWQKTTSVVVVQKRAITWNCSQKTNSSSSASAETSCSCSL